MAAEDVKPEISVNPIATEPELLQALAIREVVFIEEQHVPESMERDEDDARAFHVLATRGGHAVGTGRVVEMHEPPPGYHGRWGKVGRMAVLKAERRHGIGSKLLTALEQESKRRGFEGILLNAQVTALGFYTVHGYSPVGDRFDEAGMPHQQMLKKLA